MSILAIPAAWAIALGAALLLASARVRERRLARLVAALRARAVADEMHGMRARAEIAVLARECRELHARLARFEDRSRGAHGRFVRKGRAGEPGA